MILQCMLGIVLDKTFIHDLLHCVVPEWQRWKRPRRRPLLRGQIKKSISHPFKTPLYSENWIEFDALLAVVVWTGRSPRQRPLWSPLWCDWSHKLATVSITSASPKSNVYTEIQFDCFFFASLLLGFKQTAHNTHESLDGDSFKIHTNKWVEKKPNTLESCHHSLVWQSTEPILILFMKHFSFFQGDISKDAFRTTSTSTSDIIQRSTDINHVNGTFMINTLLIKYCLIWHSDSI